jgi:hypothetical protein
LMSPRIGSAGLGSSSACVWYVWHTQGHRPDSEEGGTAQLRACLWEVTACMNACMHSPVGCARHTHPLEGIQPAVVCHTWLHGLNLCGPLCVDRGGGTHQQRRAHTVSNANVQAKEQTGQARQCTCRMGSRTFFCSSRSEAIALLLLQKRTRGGDPKVAGAREGTGQGALGTNRHVSTYVSVLGQGHLERHSPGKVWGDLITARVTAFEKCCSKGRREQGHTHHCIARSITQSLSYSTSTMPCAATAASDTKRHDKEKQKAKQKQVGPDSMPATASPAAPAHHCCSLAVCS